MSPLDTSGESLYATVAVKYSTLPTGTGFSKVEGSRAMNEGRECENADAQVKASSKVVLRRKPPNIMKLWRLRYWGCIIWTDWMRVDSIQRALSGLRDAVFGSGYVSRVQKIKDKAGWGYIP